VSGLLQLVGIAGLAAFLVSSLAVGLHLLALARRTRAFPELAMGSGFVVGGFLGYVPETLVVTTGWVPAAWQQGVLLEAEAAIAFSALAMALFTWHVFRPHAPWAPPLVAGVAVLLVAGVLAFPAPVSRATSETELQLALATALLRCACFAWASLESLRYYRAMQRRARLGLADPVLAQRFGLWGAGAGAAALLASTSFLSRTLLGTSANTPPWMVTESALGLVAAASLWRAFFAAPSLRRRVAGDAPPA
jgi:hypothetical protein